MGKITVQLHPSMKIHGKPDYFEGEFFNETILQSITELLNKEPDIMNLCLQNGGAKPGILYLADKMELHSLNLLNSKIEESSIAIKIVPILHGG